MKKILWLMIFFSFLNIPATFAQKINKDFIDGEVYIKIKKDIPFNFDTLHNTVDINSKLSFLLPLADKYKITKAEASFYFSKSDKLQRTFRIHFKRVELVDLLITEMKHLNQIEYAEKIPIMKMDYTPNDIKDNSTSGQYALYNVHAKEAWDVTRGNFETLIAVVDNAVDIDHPDLSLNVYKARDVANNDNNPRPPDTNPSWNHGTHTSGIACATSDNSTGIASIGFNNGLIAVKATSDIYSGTSTIDYGFEGIAWATSNGANVISCSWGSPNLTLTGEATINDAYDANVVVVASAGNNNNNVFQFPASYDHVLAVASVDKTDTKASSSSYGNWVDVAPPGVTIYSTLPTNQYGVLSGTSMAAPLVAGLCGLVRSVNPGLSNDEVVNDVISTTDNIDIKNPGFEGLLGSGRINAFRAVENILPCNPSINLGAGIYSVPKTESSGTITSANLLADVQILFDAKTLVDLTPGFFVANGRAFHAYIDGCGNTLFSTQYTKSKKSSGINKEGMDVVNNTVSVNSVQVFPNPANKKIEISYQLNQEGNITFTIYNMEGIVVYQGKGEKRLAGKFYTTIDVSNLKAGVYLLKCQTNNTIITSTKIVIIH
jgi:hypothetical protein